MTSPKKRVPRVRKPNDYQGNEFDIEFIEDEIFLSTYSGCCDYSANGIVNAKEAKELHAWLTKAILYLEQKGGKR